MPLLFYWPMIVWMGMFEAAQNDMRVRSQSARARRALVADRAKLVITPAPARSP